MSAVLRKKSPRAPSMALEEAIERTAKAYARDRLHPAPTDVVAQHLGYKSANNGAALQALASLRYYGLVDRPTEGMLAVTKSYESYHYAPDEDLRRKLTIGWLRTPPIFAELLDKYENGLPSDATLRHELITQRGFIPSAADSLISVLKKSVDFAHYFEPETRSSITSAGEQEDGDEAPAPERHLSDSFDSPRGPVQRLAGSEPEDLGAVDKIPVRLSGGRRAWLYIPTPFYSADKARIKAQVDLLLSDDEDDEGHEK